MSIPVASWVAVVVLPGRRARLEDLGLDQDPIRIPPWYRGEADDILAVSAANGLEGGLARDAART